VAEDCHRICPTNDGNAARRRYQFSCDVSFILVFSYCYWVYLPIDYISVKYLKLEIEEEKHFIFPWIHILLSCYFNSTELRESCRPNEKGPELIAVMKCVNYVFSEALSMTGIYVSIVLL
jgi:hypothetical protein